MWSFKNTVVVAVLSCMPCTAAIAQNTYGGLPCDEFCQAWMNSASPQETQPQQTGAASRFEVTIARGTSSMINDYYSVRPDCRSRGHVRVSLSSPPRNGQVTLDSARMRPRFSPEDRMAVCNIRKVDVTRVFYGLDQGFKNDDFTLLIEYPNGETSEESYSVTAR